MVFCPSTISNSLVVRCIVTMRDTFGDRTIILMRSIQSSLNDAFNIRETSNGIGINIPYSMEPNIDKFGETYLSFVLPPQFKSNIKISFAGAYIPSLKDRNVTNDNDKYKILINLSTIITSTTDTVQ